MSVGSSGYDQRMMREARMGLMIIIALFVTLIYFGYQYLRSRGNHIPDSVWQSPLAVEIDPDDVLQMTRRRMGRELSPERDLQGIRGERFADQRTEFQPTQPLPQNLLSSRQADEAKLRGESSQQTVAADAGNTSATLGATAESTLPRSHESAKASPTTETGTASSATDSSLFQPGLSLPKQVPTVSQSESESVSRADSNSANGTGAASQPLGLTALPSGGSPRMPSAKQFQPIPGSSNTAAASNPQGKSGEPADTKSPAEPANFEPRNGLGSPRSWNSAQPIQSGAKASPSASGSGEFSRKQNPPPADLGNTPKSAAPNQDATLSHPQSGDLREDSGATTASVPQASASQRVLEANQFGNLSTPEPQTTPPKWPELQTPSTAPSPAPTMEKNLATNRPDRLHRLMSPASGSPGGVGQSGNSTAVDEWPRKYELKSHQSMWDAAQQVYGDGQWFRALYQHNLSRLENAVDRQQSVSLECPAPLELASRFPELAPPDFAERDPSRLIDNTQYTTLAGDSLFEIARQQLGQASRYLELLELNRSQLPPGVNHLTRLPAGIELILPR